MLRGVHCSAHSCPLPLNPPTPSVCPLPATPLHTFASRRYPNCRVRGAGNGAQRPRRVYGGGLFRRRWENQDQRRGRGQYCVRSDQAL